MQQSSPAVQPFDTTNACLGQNNDIDSHLRNSSNVVFFIVITMSSILLLLILSYLQMIGATRIGNAVADSGGGHIKSIFSTPSPNYKLISRHD